MAVIFTREDVLLRRKRNSADTGLPHAEFLATMAIWQPTWIYNEAEDAFYYDVWSFSKNKTIRFKVTDEQYNLFAFQLSYQRR